MIGRVLLAALLAGIAAGLVMALLQFARITPLIIAAEKYETSGAHEHGAGTPDHAHDHDADWKPDDGLERTLYTALTAMVTGAAFAAMLAGAALLLGKSITPQSGVLWGLAGFIAVSLAPAAGLPPELPGMAAADLGARQVWWIATIALTAAGLALFAFRRELWAKGAGALAIALPHLMGAPQPANFDGAVPPGLAALFVANSLAANAVFWCVLGTVLGFALSYFAKDAAHGP